MSDRLRKLRYSGPQVRVVELDTDVADGQLVYGPSALAATAGFTDEGPAPKDATQGLAKGTAAPDPEPTEVAV